MDDQSHVHQEGQFQPRAGVSFPGKPEPKKKNLGVKVVILIVLLLLIGGIAWFLLSNDNPFSGGSISPTPTTFAMSDLPTDTPVPTSAPVAKTDLQVQVQNGTGVPGEASYLQKELEKLGFSNIDTGNADNKNYTKTQVSFASRVPDEIKTEVAAKLQELYSSVDVDDTATAGVDVKIITGTRKGQKTSSTSSNSSPTPTVKGLKTSTTPTPTTKTVTGSPTGSITTVTPTISH